MTTIVMATGNKHKVAEMRELLAPYMGNEYRLVSMKEAGFDGDIEENGKTFAENAYIKASTVCKATGEITIADDSGLCVDALGGRPGVYSSRYCGDAGYDVKIPALLDELKSVPDEKRTAYFEADICCVFPDGRSEVFVGRCNGSIAYSPAGNGDFGYDPVFYYPPFGKTFAEMTKEEKNSISHRGDAVRKFIGAFFGNGK